MYDSATAPTQARGCGAASWAQARSTGTTACTCSLPKVGAV